ncbi:MAG: hypothetical protein ACRDD1_16215, partial [Planctomycetia bacterium]
MKSSTLLILVTSLVAGAAATIAVKELGFFEKAAPLAMATTPAASPAPKSSTPPAAALSKTLAASPVVASVGKDAKPPVAAKTVEPPADPNAPPVSPPSVREAVPVWTGTDAVVPPGLSLVAVETAGSTAGGPGDWVDVLATTLSDDPSRRRTFVAAPAALVVKIDGRNSLLAVNGFRAAVLTFGADAS